MYTLEGSMAGRPKLQTATHRWCGSCKQWLRKAEFYRNGKRLQAWCKPCMRKQRVLYYERHREAVNQRERYTRLQSRLRLIAAYGGKCQCCGETHFEFLTIDHTNGGGNIHRRRVGGSKQLYRLLERQGYPREGYRLLCYNCNCSHGALGYCPHISPSKSC